MLGDNIRQIRKEKNISINKLSKETGISLGYISDLENNKAKNPSLEKLKTIAKVLGCPVNCLLDAQEKLNFTRESLKIINDLASTALNDNENTITEFNTPEEAIKFILKQPTIMKFGGFDINKMSNKDIIAFANDLLNQLEILSYKYKK